jgi:hypothetical protein
MKTTTLNVRQLFVFVLLCSGSLLAQISGTVTDPSGSVVPMASIELKAPASGLHRTVTTDDQGSYAITALSVGTYDLTISKSGFGAETVEHIDQSRFKPPSKR